MEWTLDKSNGRYYTYSEELGGDLYGTPGKGDRINITGEIYYTYTVSTTEDDCCNKTITISPENKVEVEETELERLNRLYTEAENNQNEG